MLSKSAIDKHKYRMNRNRLKGSQGDQLNVILSAAGMNFKVAQAKGEAMALLHPMDAESG